MTRLLWNPAGSLWDEMERFRQEMDRLFGSFGRLGGLRAHSPGVFPAMNLSSDERSVTVRCEMPGVPMENIDLSITRDTLTLKGHRERDGKDEDVSYHRRERRMGYFNRTITLPFEVDPEKAQASYKDGVLTVTVERAAKNLPKKISIAAG